MFFNPLGTWLRGLLSVACLIAGVLLIKEWFDELPRELRFRDVTGVEHVMPLEHLGERLDAWHPTPDRSTGLLVAGALLLLFTFGGRVVSPRLWRKRGAPPIVQEPKVHALKTKNGYVLHVEEHGDPEGPPLVLVHGLGSDRTQWLEAIEDLGGRFRIFVFDLLGHGRSTHDPAAAHTLEAAAQDLDDVVGLAGTDGLVLVGHSMGGMIAMTWCTRHPRRASRMAGLVLVHTAARNPFTTMEPVALNRALQKPVHEPLLRITPPLAPLVRVFQRLDLWNGNAHRSNATNLFGGSETREQLDRTARLYATLDPGANARFTLSMARFDHREELRRLRVPTLVVGAEKDGTTRAEASREIATLVPGARLVMLPGMKHLGYVERRSEFADALLGWADGMSGRHDRAAGA